jgi:short-subunit dehydrogenase
MARKVSDSVVVVTGASSGVGRATALELASAGAKVVLAARREGALSEAAAECQRRGGEALAVPTDVRDAEAVQRLAGAAAERFGRIDVWVNNAAVSMFGRFGEAPYDIWREVVEVDFFGYVHGARAVLPRFREQGRGTLINVASVNSHVAFPYISSYVASKFAIRGFAESLREEVRGENIDVCTIKPAAIDTPLFQHAANYTGRAAKPLRPFMRPERVAAAIVRCIERPRREVFVGLSGRQMALFRALAPALAERVLPKLVEREHFLDKPQPPTPGNVLAPDPAWTGVTGGWKEGDASPRGAPARTAAAVGAGAASVLASLVMAALRRGRTAM